MTVRVSHSFPNSSEIREGADQREGQRRNDAEQDDANEWGEPQAVQRIHYVFAEQDPIAGEDLEQGITVASSSTATLIRRHVVVKWVVEHLQVS